MQYFHVLIFSLLAMLATSASAGPVDINTADAAMLATAIDGVGEKKAESIVRHRETNGPFTSVDDLAGVKGVGALTVERNRQNLTVVQEAGKAQVADK